MLQFIIATNLVLLATANITENNGTTTTEYDYDYTTSEVTSYRYPGMIVVNSTTTTTTEKVSCRSDQWQCADGACVAEEFKCDGAFHCEDGSDETRANCKDSSRDILGLLMHCTVERWTLKDGVCPDICKTQPEYCAYAFLAEQQPALPGICILPDFDPRGSYNITKLDRTSKLHVNDFFLEFECDYGTELVGEEKPECVNGTWKNDTMPYCSETCELSHKSEHTYTCQRGNTTKGCGKFVAIGTEVIVEKYDKKVSNSSIKASAMCTEDRKFNVSSDCVGVLDTRQAAFEKDVLNKLSEFEKKFKETTQPSFDFEELVRKYRQFEDQVTKNNTDLSMAVAVCDIHLDLLESSRARERKE